MGAVALVFGVLGVASVASAVEIGGSGISWYWGNTGVSSQTVGGGFNTTGPRGVAVNDDTGDVYVVDTGNNRIQQFTGDGAFVRTWGQDVIVNVGAPPNSNGTGYEVCDITTLPANSADQCKAGVATAQTGGALNAPGGVAVDQQTGDVYVVDGGGTATNRRNRVQVFTSDGRFVRAFGQDVIVNTGTPANSNGTGYEVCDTTTVPANTAADCKAGIIATGLGGTINAPVPSTTAWHSDLTVAPQGAPNAGNVLVSDPIAARVQEFTSSGAFVRAFGWDVDASNPSTGFEVCTTVANCKVGVTGGGVGQFAANAVRSVAEDADGNIYTVEAPFNAAAGTSNFRVQRFTLSSGNELTPQGAFACDLLCGTTTLNSQSKDSPFDVAVDDDGYVYVTKAFPDGSGAPPVVTPPDTIVGPGWQHRVLKVAPDSGELLRTFLANAGRFNKDIPASARAMHGAIGLTGLAVAGTGLPLYVVNAPTSSGSSYSRVFRIDDIEGVSVSLSASDVSASSATLDAAITPADLRVDTSYYFQYSRAGADDWSLFRIPDAADQDDVGVNIGDGSDGGESSSCAPSAGRRAAICHVSQRVDGLERNRAYEYRVVASTHANGLVYVSDHGQFETAASSPVASTGPAVWSGPPATEPSLTFNGKVNPSGDRTSFDFEYGTEGPCSASPCKRVSVAARDIGHGVVDLDVNATAAGLDPSVAYHYRLVATNAQGAAAGVDRVVDPPTPGDRFIELVSNGDSRGMGVYRDVRLAVSDDGDRAMFTALAFGEQESSPSITTPNIARRVEGEGWKVASMKPDPAVPAVLRGRDETAFDAQLSEVLWLTRPSPSSYSYRWKAKRLDGSYTDASAPFQSLRRVGGDQDRFQIKGASLDQSTVVFAGASQTGGKTFFADESLFAGGSLQYSNLYALRGAGSPNPSLSLVNRRPDGQVVGGACGARLGAAQSGVQLSVAESTRAVSADGSVVYFSARPGNPATCGDIFVLFANPVRIFKRVDDSSTVEVTACAKTPPATCTENGDDYFSGASADGRRVYFTSPRQLTDGDGDTGAACGDLPTGSAGCDLYLYDAGADSGQRLTQVSAGEVVAGDHPTVGSGANVLGVVDVSMDGSRVYFVAEGRLTDEATAGAPNLYVFERDGEEGDRIAFVAKLSARTAGEQFDAVDQIIWSRLGAPGGFGKMAYALPYYDGLGAGRGDGDGHLLVFVSEERLDPSEDGDSTRDLYRYDDETGQLECLSCDGNLAFPVTIYDRKEFLASTAATVQQQRIASEDGSAVVFTTREQLSDDDANTAIDVYLWRQGEGISLVSGATGNAGIVGSGTFENDKGGVISPDGQSVFFMTRATILPQDTNNGAIDWYAARVGGGFPQSGDPGEGCEVLGGGCHGGDEPPVVSDSRTGPGGGGNAPATPRKTVALGKPSSRQSRRAARTGVLALRVRSNRAGVVRVVARGRVGDRVRALGSVSKRLAEPGAVTVRLRLSKRAVGALRKGRRLTLTVVARSTGARPQTTRIVLRRVGK